MATEQGSENMLRLFPEQGKNHFRSSGLLAERSSRRLTTHSIHRVRLAEWAAEVRSLLQKAQYKGSSTEKWKRIDKLGEKYDEANTNSKVRDPHVELCQGLAASALTVNIHRNHPSKARPKATPSWKT